MRRLLIRPGAIGDFICSLPALEFLAAGHETEIWAASPNVSLVRFAAARSIASTGLDRLGITHADDVIERLRRFGCIHSWYGAKRPEFRELTHALGLPFRFHDALPPSGSSSHAVDFYLEQVGGPKGEVPRIRCAAGPRTPVAVIHPFSGSGRKNWPLERFRELGRLLSQRMTVAWTCGPEEHLQGAIRIPALFDLACWLSTASVFVGNDSGIAHLAAAVGTPVKVLWGPTDPTVWAPRGPDVCLLRQDRTSPATIANLISPPD